MERTAGRGTSEPEKGISETADVREAAEEAAEENGGSKNEEQSRAQ